MNGTVRKKLIWILPLLWTAVIFSASLQSGEDSGALSGSITGMIYDFLTKAGFSLTFETLHFLIRKAAHFTEYAILGILVKTAIQKAPLLKSDTLSLLSWMILIPLCDEGIQHFVSGRFGAIEDSLLDMSGFAFGALLVYLILRFRK